jgi:hypothetical protein
MSAADAVVELFVERFEIDVRGIHVREELAARLR